VDLIDDSPRFDLTEAGAEHSREFSAWRSLGAWSASSFALGERGGAKRPCTDGSVEVPRVTVSVSALASSDTTLGHPR